ncbi:hypothetical protein PYK79_41320 [Streptomyces sp. ID05-04B]|uniref:hypothetical protein n=1 Tax=Streptomyces sp. ID05-04B TaxID=3028661 RepID=UPI0029C55C74|nr:hypothetical protein [Streptomyces sp. ID05-04B]MDX5568445.1 hypothetical protein [Streptomyces sp. ID05-04B]
MLPNCDCGACCEPCGHYDDCIRNAGRERNVADEVAMEDGYRLLRKVPAQPARRTA